MLLRIFFLIAVVVTVLLEVLWLHISMWSLFLIPILWVCLTVAGILFLFIVSLFCYGKQTEQKERPVLRALAYETMDCILTFFRFRVQGEGLEKVPEEPCVLVCNHLSRFDPMVTFVLMKGRRLAFVSKEENMRIPIAGPIIQKIGFVPLDRDNPLRAMRAIHTAAKQVSEKGFTMGIYPEGTRSFEGELLEFKTGAFVMAKKAKAPVVICRISGTNDYHGRFPFRRTPCSFHVLEVLDENFVSEKKPEELAEYCREAIAKAQ